MKPGDPLLRIAKVKGAMGNRALHPRGHINVVRESLDKSAEGELDVAILLISQPHRTFAGKLRRDGLGGETVVKDDRVVLPARARITDPDLAAS